MSARKTIAALEKQIADNDAHRRERYEKIFTDYTSEGDRDAAIERDKSEYAELQDRLLQTLRQEHAFLLKQNATLRLRREMRGVPVAATQQQALKQRLVAKLASRNTIRAAWI